MFGPECAARRKLKARPPAEISNSISSETEPPIEILYPAFPLHFCVQIPRVYTSSRVYLRLL